MALRGVKLDFSEEGKVSLNLNEEVQGFDATVQNISVNLLMYKGSDKLFRDKGTNLSTKVSKGHIMDSLRLAHECNFAALDTVKFNNAVNTYNTSEFSPDFLNTMSLVPVQFDKHEFKVFTRLSTVSGESIDFVTPVKYSE